MAFNSDSNVIKTFNTGLFVSMLLTFTLGVVTLYAALIILFNLAADLAYGWLDPRIRG